MSRAPENMAAASSRAPPKRLPIVRRPDARDEIRSLPARVATIVFIALWSVLISAEEQDQALLTQRQRDRGQPSA